MSSVPKFTAIQNVLKRAFFSKDKSITIYTEDKPSDKYLYSIIIERLDLGDITVNDIIPLGPKSQVIESSIRSKGTKNKSLFIVDSDIKLMNEDPVEGDNIIGLNKYCVENYLCCEIGLVEYLYPKLGKEKKVIKKEINFHKEIKDNLVPIIKLYHRYLLSQLLSCGCSFKTFSQLQKGSEPNRKLDKSKLKTEIENVENALKNKLKASGINSFAKEMKNQLASIENKNPKNIDTALNKLSGKHQLFHHVREIIIRLDVTSRHLNNDQLKRLLAERFDIRQLDFLKDKIINIV